MALLNRKTSRDRIHKRIRKRVNGTAERPRLAVHFSGKHVYAQVIDDDAGETLVSAATTEEKIVGKSKAGANRASAELVGKIGRQWPLDRRFNLRHGFIPPSAGIARKRLVKRR